MNLYVHGYNEIAEKYEHMKREQQRHRGGAGVATEDVTMQELPARGPGMIHLAHALKM